MNLNDLHNPALAGICQRFGVSELYVFGSIVTGQMTEESDLDFIVRFENRLADGAFDRFMDFKEALENLYQRRVDLLTLKPFRNSIFQAEVDQHRTLLYAA